MSARWRSIFRATLAPGAIFILAIALRLHGLGRRSLWLDEVFTLNRAQLAWSDLVAQAAANMHQPTYYALVRGMLAFGDSAWLLRLPSAAAGALGAALICAVGRAVAGPVAGLAAGVLMAVSPFQILYSQEARPHMLVAFAVHLALLGLVVLARDADADRPATGGDAPIWPWIAYATGTAGALFVLNGAIPWVIAANLAAIAVAHRLGPARRGFVVAWIAVQVCVLAVWLPTFLAMADAIARAGRNFWIPPPTIDTFTAALSAVYAMRVTDVVMFHLGPQAAPGLGWTVAALALLGAWRLRAAPATFAVVAAALLVLPLFLLLMSIRQPVFLPRYLLWSAGPFFVLAGAGFAALPARWRLPAGLLLGALAAWNLHAYDRYETKPRWDLAVRHVAAQARPGDVVLARDYGVRTVFSATARRAGLKDVAVADTAEPALQAWRRGGRVWVPMGRVGLGPAIEPDSMKGRMAELGLPAPAAFERFGESVYLFRFDPPPPF